MSQNTEEDRALWSPPRGVGRRHRPL